MRVWVTRAEPGARETAARLQGMGYEALVGPLLEARPLPEPPLELAAVGALVFTSANAVRMFSRATTSRNLPVYTVGDATAEAARDAGFGAIVSARGDVAALARFLINHRAELAGSILHPCALEPAGDLVGSLTEAGISAQAVAIYETVAVMDWPPDVRAALDQGELAAVLIHSPKAGRVLSDLLGAEDPPLGAQLRVFALSPACAAPLEGLNVAELTIADAPQEESLLQRLRRHLDPDTVEQDGGGGRSKPVFTPFFLALMLLSLACILVGALIGFRGAELFPPSAAQSAPLARPPTPGK
jgi:uroporphyrinogen-III synthase